MTEKAYKAFWKETADKGLFQHKNPEFNGYFTSTTRGRKIVLMNASGEVIVTTKLPGKPKEADVDRHIAWYTDVDVEGVTLKAHAYGADSFLGFRDYYMSEETARKLEEKFHGVKFVKISDFRSGL